jgi:pyridoxine 5-phosphate synthase
MAKLFVNIDHVATIRNQRGTKYPDILSAAKICEENGASGITVHLREDRRHIKDCDVRILKDNIKTKFNLEMAATDEMIEIAKKIKPHFVCIVPEKREELTTEGGLDVKAGFKKLKNLIEELQVKNSIKVSLFIEPNIKHIDISKKLNTYSVELHTGAYANAKKENLNWEKEKILNAIKHAKNLNLKCNLGHGLDYENIAPFLGLESVSEFNIGHSIVSYAVLYGLAKATKEMNDLVEGK